MERRKFLGWVGVGVLASSLPVVIAACNSSTEDEPVAEEQPTDGKATNEQSTTESSPEIDRSVREDGFQAFGTVEELDKKGSIVDKEAGVLLVRNPENNKISAVNPKCPHQGCIVDWKADEKQLVCPCHSSKFDADGKLLKGPATEPLPTYETKEEDKVILVKLS